MDDFNINELGQRPLLKTDASFVHRITSHAFALQKPLTLRQQFALFWDEIRQSVFIPTPALTFAVLALFGFALGALTQGEAVSMTPLSVLYETREMI